MANTVEYYLSKGFDRKTAEYFAAGKKRITGVVPNNDFTLTISAWDIDPNIDSNKVWSNKVDLCPDGCYIDSVPVGGVSGA